jgi:hypothetical protein
VMGRAQQTHAVSKGKQPYREPPSQATIGEYFTPCAHAVLIAKWCVDAISSDEVSRSAMSITRSSPSVKHISWGGLQRTRDTLKWRIEANVAEVRQLLRQDVLLVSAIEWLESRFPVVCKSDGNERHPQEDTTPDGGQASHPLTMPEHMDVD